MKATVSGKELREALELVGMFVNPRGFNAVTSSVLLEAREGVTLRACDGSNFCKTLIGSATEEPGAVTVNHALLKGAIAGGSVVLELDKTRLIVTDQGFVSKIPVIGDASEFPEHPEPQNLTDCDPSFWQVLADVGAACSDDDSRPYLTCVYCDDGAMVASDTHRLHLSCGAGASGLMPPLAAKAGPRIEARQVGSDDSKVYLESPGHSVVLSKVYGEYPNWQRVVPQEFSSSLLVDSKELKDALRFLTGKCGLIDEKKRDRSERVRFVPEKAKLTLRAISDTGQETTCELPCAMKGAMPEFALNRVYTSDAVAFVGTEGCCIQAIAANRPLLFSETAGTRDRFAIVMPMALGDR